MPKSSSDKEAAVLITRHFGLEASQLATVDTAQLKDSLVRVLQHFLDRDFAGLLNALYRIDIREEVLKEILNQEAPENIAPKLADTILDRVRQKISLREKYKNF